MSAKTKVDTQTLAMEDIDSAMSALGAFMYEYGNTRERGGAIAMAIKVTAEAVSSDFLGHHLMAQVDLILRAYAEYRAKADTARADGTKDRAKQRDRRSQLNGACSAESWNAAHPVGTRVRYWPVYPPIESAPPLDTMTRSEAWALGDGTVVVKISGRAGGVHLAHIELLEGRS